MIKEYDISPGSPYDCGQYDAFFDKPMNPRMLDNGIEVIVTTTELIGQYVDGYMDNKEFYADRLDKPGVADDLEYKFRER